MDALNSKRTGRRQQVNTIAALVAGAGLVIIGLLFPQNGPYHLHWLCIYVGVSSLLGVISNLTEGADGKPTALSLTLLLLALVVTGFGLYEAWQALLEMWKTLTQ